MSLKEKILQKERNKTFFYSIEVLANSEILSSILNFTKTDGMIQPLFTSLVWLGESYSREKSIFDVISLKVAQQLQRQPYNLTVMPHLSCYHLTKEKLQEFLQMKFSNTLVVRGDQWSSKQEYLYASQLIQEIRKLENKGNSVNSVHGIDSKTIAVAAYPEGHSLALTRQENIQNLLSKISAGADIIITQMCFTIPTVIEFIKCCRSHFIHSSILVGIFIPFNMDSLNTFLKVTNIKIPDVIFKQYQRESLKSLSAFHDYAIRRTVELIQTVFQENLGIYGIHFYTMNNLCMIPKLLDKLRKNKFI